MAERTRIDLGACLADAAGGVLLKVRISAGASRDRLLGLRGDALKLSVVAPPERGKANQAVCALVAAGLGLARNQVSVASGATSPDKTLELAGLSRADALARLGRWADAD